MQHLELLNWTLKAGSSDGIDPESTLRAARAIDDNGNDQEQPMQVHEFLIHTGAAPDVALENGDASGLSWIDESDWVYETDFAAPQGKGPHFLRFNGLDTWCEVFLNGAHMGTSRSMYLPMRVDVTARLRDRNHLMLYIHRHKKVELELQRAMPPEWNGEVPVSAAYRRMHDYGCRPGDKHGFRPIGVFDSVLLESVTGGAELKHMDVEVALNMPLTQAQVSLTLEGVGYGAGDLSAQVEISEADGSNPRRLQFGLEIPVAGEWSRKTELVVENPKLWWPKNYGGQPMYRARATLVCGGQVVQKIERPFGIRKLEKIGDMAFQVNGTPIRMWGANLSPIYGPSNRYNRAYAMELIEKIDLGGFNATRVWGPSQPYPDEFYDEFDRRGILMWQDFPTGGSQMPDTEEYRQLFLAEARHMVKRLKHHPCIYLWCGGNENIYMSELRGEQGNRGFDILINGFRDVCAKLDPQRYYHPSCPYIGHYTNDPMVGDSHGSRALRAYCPGEPYGVFYSENIRVYPPQYKSFARWRGEQNLWEDGYVDAKPFGCVKPVPKLWQKLLGNHGEEKFGPIWDYYAATNVRELVYKHTAAAGQDLYQMYARARRGNPAHKASDPQHCKGFVAWKMNDPWPNYYCAFLDYYLEPSLPYYAAKRACRPLLLDFEVSDRVYLWGVNDTREHASGTLVLTLYDLETESITHQEQMPASLLQGRSGILTDLDRLGSIPWYTLLHAELRSADGAIIAAANAYLTVENRYPFHDAKIGMRLEGSELVLTADKFARCVEVSAGQDGMAFGWVFEDNFFDLFPFEQKRIKIQRRGAGNLVRAQAQYSPHVNSIQV
jgi:beta-galactosidase/beta-glucuronidase